MTKQVQLVVIGAGPGGYAAAFLGADLGLEVVLIDKEPNPGGVCLYRGCIPSKALLHIAKLMGEVEEAKQMGVEYAVPNIDVDKLRGWKSSVVERLTGGLGQLSKRRQIRYIQGTAAFSDAHTIDVDPTDGAKEAISFEHAIIAAGSRPTVIPALDLKAPRVLDSTSALDIDSIPDSLLVVGGGYIGLELGSVYAALGSKVSVVEMLPGILPGADRDMVNILKKRLDKKFESIMVNTTVASMTEKDDGITVTFEGDGAGEAIFGKILVSVGRKPNTENLGLETTNIKTNDRGFIDVDAQLRTAEPSIFAIGDVVGEPMLAHKASHEGRTAVEAIAGHKVAFEPRAIPAVIFTDPEIAWAGLTATEATDGLTKLIVEPKTNRILGVGIVGAGAGELIAEGVLAIEMGANATDLKLTIHPHPTLSETVMESAEVFFGQSTHVYRPRRK
jgi:dihydrolipoamide dehydrogenase